LIAELPTKTVKEDLGNIDTSEARVLLLEGLDRILPPLHQNYSKKHKHI
jgi:NADH dehydrogenase